MTIRSWLSEVDYQKLAIRSWLSEVDYQKLTIRSWLSEVDHQKLTFLILGVWLGIHLVKFFVLKRIQKYSRDVSLEILSSFIFLRKIKICVCQCISLERANKIRGQDLRPLFVKPDWLVSAPTISRWIMIVLNPSGTDTKTFTGHSTRTAPSSKAKRAGFPTRGNFKTRVLVKGIKIWKALPQGDQCRGSSSSAICFEMLWKEVV